MLLSFISIAFVVVKLCIFKFSEEQRVQFLAASGWFLGKPKMRSTLYKIFTSDPLQGDAMDLI